MSFKLEKFEFNAYTRQFELAARDLLDLILDLNRNFGGTGEDFSARIQAEITQESHQEHLATRICSAASCLLSDPNFHFSNEGLGRLLTLHRWLSALFSSSAFVNADHILRSFDTQENWGLEGLNIRDEHLPKLCALYTTESTIPLNLDILWSKNPNLTASLCLALLSPRFLGAAKAHEKRENILPWISKKLPEIKDIDQLPIGILHDVYMHCSYADRRDKHDIKRSINIILSRLLDREGVVNTQQKDLALRLPAQGEKPTLLVVLEWFSKAHSIYRTHSRTMEGAKKRFNVLGAGLAHAVDPVGRAVFDEFIELKGDNPFENLRQIQLIAQEKNVHILYMPSVGMFPLTMFLANRRFAPIQAMALGHPATTHADAIDYVIVEEDYVGDPGCFSEELLILPKDGMPYRPSAEAEGLNLDYPIRESPETVQICVASTPMKINPGFLSTLAEVAKKSKTPVHFNFLVGQGIGLTYLQLKRVIRFYLGDTATVHPHQPYKPYMNMIAKMDLFLNPFPFGNTNGIIDTVTAGLVGVCKTGPEVHEHIDEGLFRRLRFPRWLVASSNDEYAQAAARLIDNHKERCKLRKELSGLENVKKIFSGQPEIMGQLLLEKLKKIQ